MGTAVPGGRAPHLELNLLAHRGPDGCGTHAADGVWFGHRRLKIIDLSDNARQPIANEDETIWTIVNGEIYNHISLRSELKAAGHRFRSGSDSEVVVHLYEEHGLAFLKRLRGMFALAIYDARQRSVLIARDPFGKKPLFYASRPGMLAFSSEIGPLAQSALFPLEVDRAALSSFWYRSYVTGERTAFAAIRRVAPGAAIIFAQDAGTTTEFSFAEPVGQTSFEGSYEEARDAVRSLFLAAVERRLESDVPLGISLSGGIDSACVVAAARTLTNEPPVTVTVRPPIPYEHDETPFARRTAARHGTRHQEIIAEPDFRESFERLIESIGEPFASTSAVASYYLYAALRQLVTVVLSGDGGDEVFGGYKKYRGHPLVVRAAIAAHPAIRKQIHGAMERAYGRFRSLRRFLKAPLVVLELADRKHSHRTAFGLMTEVSWEWERLVADGGRWLFSPETLLDDFDRLLERIGDGHDDVKRAMLVDQFDYLPGHGLVKVDMTSMAHAVEVRCPFLDDDLVAFTRTLPSAWFVDVNGGKKILVDAFATDIPPEVISRPKTGFGFPMREWLRGPLREYLRETLLARGGAMFDLFDRSAVKECMDEHFAGKAHHTTLILKLLALRVWMDRFHVSVS